jgi:hypothetical protein
LCALTFDMSGPPPAWPTQRNIDKRSGVGQAGGGPLDGRVRRQSRLKLATSCSAATSLTHSEADQLSDEELFACRSISSCE